VRSLTTAQAVVELLARNGIRELFCLPGVQNDPFFDALYDRTDTIRPIHTRHEQGAAYMALGAAMATGRPAAFAVVPGPGILNASAALATAYAVNAPVLALVGQIPRALIGRHVGVLHELPDQLALLRLLSKYAERIGSAADGVRVVDTAFDRLLNGRPRPVAVECPMDVWSDRGEVTLSGPAVRRFPPLDEEAMHEAAALLGSAERPLIVVGGGALEASAEVRAVAEMLDAPVVAHRMGQGILDARHPLAVTFPAGHRLWADADVVLGVGTRLQTQQMAWGVDDRMKIVRIDIDPEEIGRIRPADVAIVADAATALRAVADRLARVNRRRPGRGEAIARVKQEVDAELQRLEPQASYLRAIRDALPENGIFVDELTQVGYVSRLMFPVYAPRTFLAPGYQGTLGWGFATSLGAKVAAPDRPVVSIAGDGGFMFTVQELATAVAHRISVVAVVFTDDAYGNVRRFQQDRYNNRVIASTLVNPDFVRLADSFGVRAERAETPDALRVTLERALASGEPRLIEVPVGDMADPWEYIHMPKVRGVR